MASNQQKQHKVMLKLSKLGFVYTKEYVVREENSKA
jgi:hypothetical protein